MNEAETLELKIAKVLRYGVVFSGTLMFIGWMMQIQFDSNPFEGFHDYHDFPLFHALYFAWLAKDWALLISYAGLFVLIGLPIARVLMTGILFLKEGDRLLASIAFFVFVAICTSCYLGFEL